MDQIKAYTDCNTQQIKYRFRKLKKGTRNMQYVPLKDASYSFVSNLFVPLCKWKQTCILPIYTEQKSQTAPFTTLLMGYGSLLMREKSDNPEDTL